MSVRLSRLARDRLDLLWSRGTDFLGCDLAIMGGAMTWVSERRLVAAISNGGGFGVIACGSMDAAQLDAEIAATMALTRRPFGVNLITLHPDLFALIDVCARRREPFPRCDRTIVRAPWLVSPRNASRWWLKTTIWRRI